MNQELVRRWTWRAIQVLPSLVVLAVGARYVSAVPLWTDELWVWAAVRDGLGIDHGEVFQRPLYTSIWALTGGGQCLSEACLRWPSLVSASITVLLVGLIARHLAGPGAGLAASFLLMGIALVHRSTLEAHHYALAAMLITLTLYLLQLVSARPALRWPWPAYAGVLIVAGVLQPVALAALAGHGVLILGQRNAVLRKRWLITLVVLSPLAVAAAMLYVRAGGYGGVDSHGDLVPNLENISQAIIWPVSGGFLVLPAIGAIAGILLMLGLDSPVGRRWLLAGATSVLLVYLVSLGPRAFWFGRFLWPLIGFFVVAASVAFVRFGRWRSIGTVALVLALCYPLFVSSLTPWSRGTDFRTAMSIVDANWNTGDAFLVRNVNDQWGVERYGTADSYETVDTSTSAEFAVWSFGLVPPCFAPESWTLGPEVNLWRCPPTAPPNGVQP